MESIIATRRDTGEQVSISIERDCSIVFEGKTFESGGAMVTPDYAIGYVASEPKLYRGAATRITSWRGEDLGSAKVVAMWRNPPNCWISRHQYQIEATIEGRRYTGRSMGEGMLWRGKAKKGV